MYCLTIKVKNKKYIVATWTGDKNSCIALAKSVFYYHGLSEVLKIGSVEWTSDVVQQKMFDGYSDDCLHLTDSIEDAEIISDFGHINNFIKRGRSKEVILEVYPEFEKYFSDSKYKKYFQTT